jgi:hypothetical protein
MQWSHSRRISRPSHAVQLGTSFAIFYTLVCRAHLRQWHESLSCEISGTGRSNRILYSSEQVVRQVPYLIETLELRHGMMYLIIDQSCLYLELNVTEAGFSGLVLCFPTQNMTQNNLYIVTRSII